MQVVYKTILFSTGMILLNFFFPWWAFTFLGLCIAWFYNQLKKIIFSSTMAGIISWLPLLIYSYISGGEILYTRVSEMLGIHSPILLIFYSTILIGFLSLNSGIAGYYLRRLLKNGTSN
mgnify:CR=1 FL=1